MPPRGPPGRESLDETPVKRDARGDLCLLKHNFRDPYTVGRSVLLPGQVFAAVLVKPAKEWFGNGFLRGHEVVKLRNEVRGLFLYNDAPSVPLDAGDRRGPGEIA